MKKLLIATAALAMVAGTAQAQSSVTVYGAVGASNNSIETNTVQAAAAFQSGAQDFLGTTNLGFTGTEDLGGGNKAFFRLEGDLSMSGGFGGTITSTSVFTANSTNANSTVATTTKQALFNRHAHVGIESAKFGTISAGRQNDSVKDIEGLGQVYNLSDNLHMNTQVGDRYAQVYKYATPIFNGIKASYSYSNGADNVTSDTTDGAKTLNSYALTYTYKNYNFGYAKGTVKDLSVASDVETTLFGARAVFGNITVGAHLAQNKQGANKLDQTMVSANYTMGNIDLKAHYVTNDKTGSDIGTAGVATSDGKGYGLMGVYNLSKRTAAYVGYADFNQTDVTTYDQKVTTVGVFHKF